MAKNSKIRYYLLNGKNGSGNALDLLDDGVLKRDFIDIASLDLKTIDIPIKEAPEVLKEYNPNIDLSGYFYDVQYPYRKYETKGFAPIFKIDTVNGNYFLDRLKYFAEQRNWNVKKGESVALDKNTILDEYVDNIIYNILKYNNRRVIRQNSLVGKDIKDELNEAFKLMANMSPDGYLSSKKARKLKMLLDHYTQLRNITIEYLVSKSDVKSLVPDIYNIKNFSRYENYGLEPRERALISKEKKSDKEIKYYQLTLEDFNPNKK